MHRTVDGFVRRPTETISQRPVRRAPEPVRTPPAAPRSASASLPSTPLATTPIQDQFSPAPRPYQLSAKPVKARRQLPQWLELGLIMLGTCIAGMLAQTLVLGQLLIAVYTVFALIFNIASRTTFTLALLSMVATVGLLVMGTNEELAGNFITYTFLLLVAGVITLARELRREGGRLYTSRRT